MNAVVYESILRRFGVGSNLKLAFAYGSAVFKQKGNISSKNMVDVCLVVEDTSSFHEKNLRRNPNDYSLVGKFGLRAVDTFQNLPCDVYCNTLVKLDNDVMFKYGVLSEKVFKRDLETWDRLYYSGRLHKPVHFFHSHFGTDKTYSSIETKKVSTLKEGELSDLLKGNLTSAWNAALLLTNADSNNRVHLRNIFTSIVGLSYKGDFRMILGEDKNKVSRIVDSSWEPLIELYQDCLENDQFLHAVNKTELEVDLSSDAIKNRVSKLPHRIQDLIHENVSETDDLPMVQARLSSELASTVCQSSILQSLKNLFTAGVIKSAKYSQQKLKKMNKSKQ